MTLILGGDYSHWQDNNSTPQRVDFARARAEGMRYVFIKTSQACWRDEDHVFNWANAKAAGLWRGGYHFLTWDQDPARQAEFFWSQLESDPGELPPVADYEWWGTIPSNAYDVLYRFLERLKVLSGRQPMIYTAAGFWQPYGTPSTYWLQYPLWVAHYRADKPLIPKPWTDYAVWQYTNKGNGPRYGAESFDLDLNWAEQETLERLAGRKLDGEVQLPEEHEEKTMSNKPYMVMLYDDPIPAANVDALAAEGAEIIAVRMMQSKNGATVDEDPQYKALYKKIKATRRAVGAIIKLSPDLDLYDYKKAAYQLQGVREIVTSTHIPDLFIVAFEDHTMANGDTLTPYNLMECLKGFVEALWLKYRRPVLIYTGAWFYPHLYDAVQKTNWFTDWTSANCIESNERFPLMLVHWTLKQEGPVQDLGALVDGLPAPSAEAERTKLSAGNAKWRGWDVGRFRHAALGQSMGRLVTFRELSRQKLYEFLLMSYPGPYTPGGAQPEEPEDPGTPGETDPQLMEQIRALAARVDGIDQRLTALEQRYQAHTHPVKIDKP